MVDLRLGASCALAVLVLASCSDAGEQVAIDASPPLAAAGAREGLADADWPLHGLDSGEQRFASLDQVNRGNVAQLGLAWSFDIATPRGVEATPLVIDDVMYVTGSWSVVYALDARTGALRWSYDPQVPRSWLAKTCCDAVNRGVAYREGSIFVGTIDGRLVALEAATGKVRWDVQTTDRDQPYSITGAPRIAKDKVVIGNGGAELGVRGYVTAYDALTGAQAWRFYTVPGDPAKGFESEALERAAKTWTGEWWKWGGGGTVWDSMVYDPELELLYLGVGNGSPWNQALRSPEGGDNLYLSSIVAVRPDTGEYVWHYQTTPGETWDFTATQHMLLAELEIEGRARKVLMQAPKNGFFYVLDRETGELLSAKPYTLVNWATSIDLATGRPIETPDARVFDGVRPSIPSNGGGHNWPPMSYSPRTGLVYIPTMIFPTAFMPPNNAMDSEPGAGFFNTGFDRMGTAPPELPPAEVNAILDQAFSGQLVAWDPVRQEARWAGERGRPVMGGTLSTAGDLVFQGGKEGRVFAYDAESGEPLWSSPVQTAAMAAPITYAIDGEQYVAFAVGFGGGLAAEGGVVSHGWGIKNLPRVLAYKLGGKHTLPALDAATPPFPEPPALSASADVVARGKVVYQRQCGVCHGDGLRTGGLTPDLRRSTPAIHALWQEIVLGGVLEANGMVSFAKFVGPEDAEAIRQYVLSEANRIYALQEAETKTPAAGDDTHE